MSLSARVASGAATSGDVLAAVLPTAAPRCTVAVRAGQRKVTMAERLAGSEAPDSASLSRIAAALAAAAVVAMVVLAAADADGPIWIVQGVLAAAALVVGWRAGGTKPRNALAFGALIVGTILLVIFVGFTIAEA